MAQYNIPQKFQGGFARFAELSNEKISELAQELEKLPPGTGPETMIKAFTGRFSDLPNIDNITRTIFSLGGLLTEKNITTDEVAFGLAKSFVDIESPSLPNEQKDELINNLKEKLQTIFRACNALKISFKAFSLLTSNERLYRESRFISDIRLIFNDDLKDKSRHAVIIHNLRIDHQVDGDLQEIYFSLDTKDIQKLKEQIERALEKEIEIKSSYGNEISFIEITE